MNGSQGHYESIYKKGVVGRQINKRKYKFPITKTSLPSFIVYMLFLSVYGFDQNNEFTALRQDPIYTAEYISKNESNPIRSLLNDMYKIYTNNLQGQNTRASFKFSNGWSSKTICYHLSSKFYECRYQKYLLHCGRFGFISRNFFNQWSKIQVKLCS